MGCPKVLIFICREGLVVVSERGEEGAVWGTLRERDSKEMGVSERLRVSAIVLSSPPLSSTPPLSSLSPTLYKCSSLFLVNGSSSGDQITEPSTWQCQKYNIIQ